MQRREFLQSAAAAGAGWMLADNLSAGKAAPAPATDKLIGMYVHQHWPYRHPYAARTWTYDDWHGYLDGLSRLGFNLVLIWPVQETMPNPLTPSDRANLDENSPGDRGGPPRLSHEGVDRTVSQRGGD